MTGKAPKHSWHLLDAERGVEVRQATNRWRENRWEVRTVDGEYVIELNDEEFDRLRTDPDFFWLHHPRLEL